ncbi:MAG: glucosylceramidase [Herbinix sp.]|jgi:glucosylceramidase|nr:glucosylceramidase [Herbinix sp.]
MKLITTCYNGNDKEVTIKEYEAIVDLKGVENNVINLYPEVEYQTILGFGGAVTEASGYAFSKLTKENQEKALELYFGSEGNRYHLMRTHIDSCDFSLGTYAAMNNPEDTTLESFALTREEQYILPLLRGATEKAGRAFDLMLSPWSPPAFMKTNGDRTHGGKLKEEYRKAWAEYICRYIKEYEKKGFLVNRLTIQNEPAAVQTWDSCIYTAEEEKVFLRDYLYPTLVEQGLSHIKLNIWDHNKERMYERAKAIIDVDTVHMVDGVAFHWYSGDHFEAINLTHEVFPDKELIFTEGCVEYSRFSADQLKNAQMYAHDIMGNLNHGMTGFIDWNIFLDEKGGPNHVGNFCDAPIMVNTQTGELIVKLSYDYIGHFSKYIMPGAKRIGSSKYTSDLEATAFKNPDGTLVLVALNRTQKKLPVVIRLNGKLIEFELADSAIATALISE